MRLLLKKTKCQCHRHTKYSLRNLLRGCATVHRSRVRDAHIV